LTYNAEYPQEEEKNAKKCYYRPNSQTLNSAITARTEEEIIT
jgi:hypothetical protein